MSSALMNVVSRFTNVTGNRENFDDVKTVSTTGLLILLINVAIVIAIVGLVGQWLFNNVLTKAVPAVSRVSFWQFLGLYILVRLMLC